MGDYSPRDEMVDVDHTPDTRQVRAGYSRVLSGMGQYAPSGPRLVRSQVRGEQFDRWLAAHDKSLGARERREAWDWFMTVADMHGLLGELEIGTELQEMHKSLFGRKWRRSS